jgi:hypothetical protein
MEAGSWARASERDDSPHLAQREPYPPRLRHEGQHVEHVSGIDAIAGRRAAG